MLKKASSFVLASLRGSTYGTEYGFASSLAAAALGDLFEPPGWVVEIVTVIPYSSRKQASS